MRSSLFVLSLMTAVLSVACAVEPQSHAPPATQTTPTIAELQVQMDAFTTAIAARDVASLEAIVSNEVATRAVQRGIDLPAFLEKQRMAIMHTFNLGEGERAEIEVADVVSEGEAVRVTLRLHGEDLKKPFYFVLENGAYKLSIAPPGFSKTSPDGALFGKSNYTVHNVNINGNQSFALACYQGGSLPYKWTVYAANSTKKVSCEDHCGFWSGTTFATGAVSRQCDWNAWGDDVVINLLAPGGWYCADSC